MDNSLKLLWQLLIHQVFNIDWVFGVFVLFLYPLVWLVFKCLWELLREDVPLFNKWECIVGQGGFIKTRRLDTLQYQTLVAQSYQVHVFHHKASNKHTIVVSSFPWHNCGTIYLDININEGRFFFVNSASYIPFQEFTLNMTRDECYRQYANAERKWLQSTQVT